MNRSLLAAPLVVAAVAGAFVLGGGRSTRAAADGASSAPASTSGIVVDGLGKVTGYPDVLRATLGVDVRAADVSTALQQANTLQTKVLGALKSDGVSKDDLQTSDVSINQSYTDKGVRNGYSVTETLTVKLRDLTKAGAAITHAVNAGGNAARLEGVSFDLEDNTALLAKARDAAFADAKAKAERYAQLAGRDLGAVQLVTEASPSTPVDYGFQKDALPSAAGASSAVPIQAGTSQVSVSVTVRWALK